MCAELASAWGNERFGAVEPIDVVRLAADQHELGWAELDRWPMLDPSTGLPFTVRDLDLAVYLPTQLEGPRRLASRSPYAALLTSLHHTSLYARPRATGFLRANGRRLRSFFERSSTLQAQLRGELAVSDAEVERNWRLVRTWDGLSHDLLLERAPCTRPAVPAAGTTVDLRLERRDGGHALDPWPFSANRVCVRAHGRLLERTFSDEGRMRAALAEAREVTLTYELAPA